MEEVPLSFGFFLSSLIPELCVAEVEELLGSFFFMLLLELPPLFSSLLTWLVDCPSRVVPVFPVVEGEPVLCIGSLAVETACVVLPVETPCAVSDAAEVRVNATREIDPSRTAAKKTLLLFIVRINDVLQHQ